MKIKPLHQAAKDQKSSFIAAAKSIEADEDEKRWEARLKAVVKPVGPKRKRPSK